MSVSDWILGVLPTNVLAIIVPLELILPEDVIWESKVDAPATLNLFEGGGIVRPLPIIVDPTIVLILEPLRDLNLPDNTVPLELILPDAVTLPSILTWVVVRCLPSDIRVWVLLYPSLNCVFVLSKDETPFTK